MTLEAALLAALAPGEHHVALCKPDGRKALLLASVERGRVWLHRLERPYRGAAFDVLTCRRVKGDDLDWHHNDVPGSGGFNRLNALFADEPVQVQIP
jgi:hypothetical protein